MVVGGPIDRIEIRHQKFTTMHFASLVFRLQLHKLLHKVAFESLWTPKDRHVKVNNNKSKKLAHSISNDQWELLKII